MTTSVSPRISRTLTRRVTNRRVVGAALISLTFIVSTFAQDATPDQTTDRHVLNELFGESVLATNVLAVRKRAAVLENDKRYRFLSDWVLPGVDHDTIRVAIDFTPTHPAPPVRGEDRMDVDRLQIAEESGQSRIQIGGQLVAPALDLIEVAKELGRLEEVRDRVDRVTPTNDQQQRSRLAMLVAIDTTRGDFDAAQSSLERLFSLVQAGGHSRFSERCPETLAIWAALRHPENRDMVRDMQFKR